MVAFCCHSHDCKAKDATGHPLSLLQEEEEVLAASERPLVVVIEEAEAVDTLTLQDLILVLSEVQHKGLIA